MAIFSFPTYGLKQILPLLASPLVVGFLFSPRLLNHDVGNENITVRDSWGIYFPPFEASLLIEKNPIPTSPQMRIFSNPSNSLPMTKYLMSQYTIQGNTVKGKGLNINDLLVYYTNIICCIFQTSKSCKISHYKLLLTQYFRQVLTQRTRKKAVIVTLYIVRTLYNKVKVSSFFILSVFLEVFPLILCQERRKECSQFAAMQWLLMWVTKYSYILLPCLVLKFQALEYKISQVY